MGVYYPRNQKHHLFQLLLNTFSLLSIFTSIDVLNISIYAQSSHCDFLPSSLLTATVSKLTENEEHKTESSPVLVPQ